MSWTDWERVTDQDGNTITEEMERAGIDFHQWLMVLGHREWVLGMRRTPIPAHIIRLLDAFLPYARSPYLFFATPPGFRLDSAAREARTLELREALLRWTPPDVPTELVEAARALLRSEGLELDHSEGQLPPTGRTPDGYPASLEENLKWPE